MNFKERDKQRDKKPGKGSDTVTRNIVIGMVLLVVLAGAGAALSVQAVRRGRLQHGPRDQRRLFGGGVGSSVRGGDRHRASAHRLPR